MTEDTARQICAIVRHLLLSQRKDRVKRGFYWENQIAFAFNSEKIEGSMLTEEQTRSIFETGTIASGSPVPVDSVVEMRNHFRMFDLMLDTIDEPLTADLIKRFHGTLKEEEGAGEWKTIPNGVGGITTIAPADVDGAIGRLFEAYGKRARTTYRDIVGFHVLYERIHPFLDGNGRTGRIIMFRECLRNGLVPFIVLDAEKAEYYRAIRTFEDDGESVSCASPSIWRSSIWRSTPPSFPRTSCFRPSRNTSSIPASTRAICRFSSRTPWLLDQCAGGVAAGLRRGPEFG